MRSDFSLRFFHLQAPTATQAHAQVWLTPGAPHEAQKHPGSALFFNIFWLPELSMWVRKSTHTIAHILI